ncbi:helicase [Bacillus sp. FJAT-27225]|uniref:DEAD/DEAH box helicase n=1 Tax=Bacillus sp. FJAT-27225 TaxID=1743144 RepID=UPI00080C308D|nr:DEAD/DEAH box helicase family protein [Bacillus sp. FJAT-27225]OCA86008.1 helicase [Bacillus sp. FJAT-27225]
MKVNLPAYKKAIYKKPGNKNIIKQIICKEKTIEGDILFANEKYFSIQSEGNLYCFTTDKKYVDDTVPNILLINKINLSESIIQNIEVMQWLKHPEDESIDSNEDILKSWRNQFNFKEEIYDEEIKGLRRPQIAALYSILSHLKVSKEIATVVMPTGTGKTETMMSTMIAAQCERLLVTVPSAALRTQTSDKFITLGLLKDFEIVGNSAKYPKVGIIYEGFRELEELEIFLDNCNVIVTTMQLLTSINQEMKELFSKKCTNVFIDEAHHVKARTWDSFRKSFDNRKVIQFTATPFRNDGKNLDGKIIFNFPLSEAQKDGYFTKIEFIPVKEYNSQKADFMIAEEAVKRLEVDIKKGLPHILMARCENKNRAESVFQIYTKYKYLNPVIIYSNIKNEKVILEDIKQKKHRIIVCVDMLGEGFDLPELKVAALHDIKKSLPITLQFTGRFTRTKHDRKLGNAAFIANIADLNVSGSLEYLYSSDADWNELLSNYSNESIESEVNYKEFLEGFNNLNSSSFSFQNIKPKLSTVVYKSKTNKWNPKVLKDQYLENPNLEYTFFDLNESENVAVIVYAKRNKLDWLSDKNAFNLTWSLLILIWEPKHRLLFINSSDNESLYKDLAETVVPNSVLINQMDVFKALHNIKRIKLQNVGLKLFLGKDIRYRMSVGSDIGEALPLTEKQRSQKAYIVGAGYEDGNPVNIGCAYKGRIWTKLQGNIKHLKAWCINVGEKLINPNIDSNEVLKECLVPTMISEMPKTVPISVDWDYEVYREAETKCEFKYGKSSKRNLGEVELSIEKYNIGSEINIALKSDIFTIPIKYTVFKGTESDVLYADFKFELLSDEKVEVHYGTKIYSLVQFLETYKPTIWFADGSALTGNEYVHLKHVINLYDRELLIPYDWSQTDIAKESQQVKPLRTDSIQYQFIEKLKLEDYHIIYDDDGKGEISDVLTIKEEGNIIKIQMYHLKYAKGGNVSNDIDNLYQVCGQAQKSTQWKYKDGKEFFNHLLRRKIKHHNQSSCSRIVKGTEQELEILKDKAKKRMPMSYEIFIVQPSISKKNVNNDILNLLGVTENYIKETTGIDLKVICSS